eukprot:TRINITY_DN2919_c0_g1_i2.p1 TRINITY_DN2919_c0_g1~~TRINITY_DN2919_c0_g1_i2.p1  ORF type:complete len:223 (+),score=42.64 TRINITY_DN2919_c0_g1_i2:119-787(+)
MMMRALTNVHLLASCNNVLGSTGLLMANALASRRLVSLMAFVGVRGMSSHAHHHGEHPPSTSTSKTSESSSLKEDLVLYQNHGGGIASLTLNNPKKRNALSIPMMESLLDKLIAIEARTRTNDTTREDSERVIILKAMGPVFCAGHDLKEFYNPPEQLDLKQHHKHIFGLCSWVMETIRNLPAVVIAQVGTLATAAGCQLGIITWHLVFCIASHRIVWHYLH